MKVLVVYAHPGGDSFTREVLTGFVEGLSEGGHTYEISDLYKMNFATDMSEAEYLRESNYRSDFDIPADVRAEQDRINSCDALVFIYPVFWSEAPAKLVGWFDRVWTYGFAYGDSRRMRRLEKGLVICIAGHTEEELRKSGIYQSMRTVMLEDRLYDRVKIKEFILLGGTSKEFGGMREKSRAVHLPLAFKLGKEF